MASEPNLPPPPKGYAVATVLPDRLPEDYYWWSPWQKKWTKGYSPGANPDINQTKYAFPVSKEHGCTDDEVQRACDEITVKYIRLVINSPRLSNREKIGLLHDLIKELEP